MRAQLSGSPRGVFGGGDLADEGFEIFGGLAGDDGEGGSDAVLERVQGGTGARSGSG